GAQSAVAPLVFLREALCLNSRYRKARSCEGLPAFGYAHHAYANANGPLEHPSRPASVTIAVLSRLTRALDLAARAHAIPAGVTGGVGFQTGLMYVSGTRKPLYFGFPVPLVVSKRGHGYSLWGLVRPTTGSTKLTVLVQLPHSRRWRKLRVVSTNSSGYWSFG